MPFMTVVLLIRSRILDLVQIWTKLGKWSRKGQKSTPTHHGPCVLVFDTLTPSHDN